MNYNEIIKIISRIGKEVERHIGGKSTGIEGIDIHRGSGDAVEYNIATATTMSQCCVDQVIGS